MPEIHKYASIAQYVTNLDQDIFALKNLPEEVAAVLFAYYSRSPHSLRENLLQLLGEGDLDMSDSATLSKFNASSGDFEAAQIKAKAFHEKWVVGYGHGSVAEHSVIKLAIENVSIIVSKLIEDTRLSSYTEKSTRYVKFTEDSVYIPNTFGIEEPENKRLIEVYTNHVKNLMRTYLELVPIFTEKIMSETKKGEKQTPKGFETSCRATAFDTLRYILPTALRTNIGITVNARSLATMIIKLRSSENPEAIAAANRIKAEAEQISPTLLKYVDASPYRTACAKVQHKLILPTKAIPQPVKLVPYYIPEDQALRLIAAGTDTDDGAELLSHLMPQRGMHESAPRLMERVSLTCRIVMDYGAYRDIQRHRMSTQLTPGLDPNYCYETPQRIIDYGYEETYKKLMHDATLIYIELYRAGGLAAQHAPYVLPLGMKISLMLTANLREIFQFIELRSSRQGHPSYRSIAQQLYLEVESIYPTIAKYIRVNMENYELTRSEK